MNQPTPHGPRHVIEEALTDWWFTTDPMQPFHIPAVAEQVETYLLSSGYTITPDIPRNHRMPTRSSIALTAFLALICLGGTITSTIRSDWGWAIGSLVGAIVFTHELLGDLNERRHRRNTRPIVIDRPKNRQQQ